MNLEIEITRQDYLNFNIYHFIRTKLIRTILIGLAGLLILQYAINKEKSSFNFGAIIFSSLLYLILFSVFIYYGLTRARSIPKDDGSFLGKKSYEFSDENISFKDKDSEGRFQWTAIKHLGESKTAFYLYLDTNMAILIPKRYFIDKTEQETFNTYVRSKLNVAQQELSSMLALEHIINFINFTQQQFGLKDYRILTQQKALTVSSKADRALHDSKGQ